MAAASTIHSSQHIILEPLAIRAPRDDLDFDAVTSIHTYKYMEMRQQPPALKWLSFLDQPVLVY